MAEAGYNRYKMAKGEMRRHKAVYDVYNVRNSKMGAVVITDLLQQQDNYISAINDIRTQTSFLLSRRFWMYTRERRSP